MDRVLLIIDDIQYSRHVEMTLRKVGFDVESSNNEFNLTESILTYNPDYIICRGNTTRLSVLSIGRKLKETHSKFYGRVILIFPEAFKILPEDLVSLRMDLVLFDPMSTLKLAMHLFSFGENDFDFIRDKLLKFAITDNQFRGYEQQILKKAGLTIDSEIQVISNMVHVPRTNENKLYSSNDSIEVVSDSIILEPKYIPAVEPSFPKPEALSTATLERINKEIQALEQELPLRIDTYNHSIKKTNQDLNKGLSKRQTRKALSKFHMELISEQKSDEKSEKKLHDEKVRFTKAMFSKKS